MDWFGQPAHASPWPARVDSGPGQCSGSGAMSEGWFFRGAERSIWMGSSTVAVMVEGIFQGVWGELDSAEAGMRSHAPCRWLIVAVWYQDAC